MFRSQDTKSMFPYMILTLLLFQRLGKVGSSGTTSSVDVCIIGAGPSGIQAAYTLDGFGYTTAIFEKESYIGGKTKTLKVDGIRYRLGAALHLPRRPSSLNTLFEKFNISNPQANLKPIIHVINDNDQSIRKYTVSNPIRFLLAYFRYQWKQRDYTGLQKPDAYLQPQYSQQEQYLLPFGSWLEQNRFTSLRDVFWVWFTTFGYGRVGNVPALYGLKYVDTTTLIDEVGIIQSKITQPFFQDLLIAMVNSLQHGTVYLNTTISNVKYGASNNTITYTQTGDLVERQMICGSIIIAFPQLTSQMSPIFMPPTVGFELINLTDQVKVNDYYTILYRTDPSNMNKFNTNRRLAALILQRGSLSGPIPDENLLYSKLDPISNASVMAYYISESYKTDKQIQQLSFESYKKLTGNTAANGTIIQSFNKWEYFPHVSSKSLQDGFYEKFNNLQGKANQYYTGALFTFETVQESMFHAKYLIETFFANQ